MKLGDFGLEAAVDAFVVADLAVPAFGNAFQLRFVHLKKINIIYADSFVRRKCKEKILCVEKFFSTERGKFLPLFLRLLFLLFLLLHPHTMNFLRL